MSTPSKKPKPLRSLNEATRLLKAGKTINLQFDGAEYSAAVLKNGQLEFIVPGASIMAALRNIGDSREQ